MFRSYSSNFRSRPISSVSAKPAVVSSPVTAPRRSMSALVNSVVAWTMRVKSRRRQAVLTQEPLDAGGDGPGRVVVGGQDLAVELPAAGLVVDDDVGEGAADVDSERVAHGVSTLEPGADQVKRPARPPASSSMMLST